MAMLRMLGRDLHSNYGPTADTGGLMQDHAPTIYAYSSSTRCSRGKNAADRRRRSRARVEGPLPSGRYPPNLAIEISADRVIGA